MRVWEARKADGMEYDENDPEQRLFIAQITQNNSRKHE
jgi:phage terminase large subunit-like protein